MEQYDYEIWDNGKRELRYTILRNDGLAWICGKNKTKRNDETEPVFIGPVGSRVKHLGKQISRDKWPNAICNWVDKRTDMLNKEFV